MKTFEECGERRAFTMVELLTVIVVVFILVVLFLPGTFFNHKRNHVPGVAPRIRCLNNLKQVGLSFRLWANDNGDVYPMSFFTNQTGAQLFANATSGFRYYLAMSNELSTPRILVCPADMMRTAATNFTTDLDNSHLSYFTGLDANESNTPSAFLAGDRNLTNGQSAANGILYFQTNQNVGWTKDLHNEAGNIGMADGSVQQIANYKLKQTLSNTGMLTNRILLP